MDHVITLAPESTIHHRLSGFAAQLTSLAIARVEVNTHSSSVLYGVVHRFTLQ
jgi:hypothetical protein